MRANKRQKAWACRGRWQAIAKGNEDMYTRIDKWTKDSAKWLGWTRKDTQKRLYLALNTAAWFLVTGVICGLIHLLTGGMGSWTDMTTLALLGALMPGFYGGILYLYHTAVDEE